MTVSLNGWEYPAAKLVTKKVPGADRRLTLNNLCAPLLLAVAADYHATVRPIDRGPTDEGGYCDRDARSAAGHKSNHANGTAIDLNWSEEGRLNSPWGAKFFAKPEVRKAIKVMEQRYGLCVQWGGDAWSKNSRDWMHWEIKPGVTPFQVAALTKRLGISAAGVRKA